MMKRRDLLKAILAAGIAPAVVKAESLMRVKELPSGLVVPEWRIIDNLVQPPDDGITVEDIRKAVAKLNRNTGFPNPGGDYWGICHKAPPNFIEILGRNAGESLAKLYLDVYGP